VGIAYMPSSSQVFPVSLGKKDQPSYTYIFNRCFRLQDWRA
jgi:hypothetical protein